MATGGVHRHAQDYFEVYDAHGRYRASFLADTLARRAGQSRFHALGICGADFDRLLAWVHDASR